MLDIRYVRENAELVQTALKNRGAQLDLSDLIATDEERRALLQKVEELRNKRNTVSEEIGKLKKEKQDASSLIAEMKEVSSLIKELEKELAEKEQSVREFLLSIPNVPTPLYQSGKTKHRTYR